MGGMWGGYVCGGVCALQYLEGLLAVHGGGYHVALRRQQPLNHHLQAPARTHTHTHSRAGITLSLPQKNSADAAATNTGPRLRLSRAHSLVWVG